MVSLPPAAEKIAREETVKRELAKVTGKAPPRVRLKSAPKHKKWLAGYALAALVAVGAYVAVQSGAIEFLRGNALAGAERVTRGVLFVTLVLAASKLVGIVALGHVEDRASRYNLERVRGLLT